MGCEQIRGAKNNTLKLATKSHCLNKGHRYCNPNQVQTLWFGEKFSHLKHF